MMLCTNTKIIIKAYRCIKLQNFKAFYINDKNIYNRDDIDYDDNDDDNNDLILEKISPE